MNKCREAVCFRLGTKERIAKGEFEPIRKPALNVMAAPALLGDERVAADPPGDAYADDVRVLAGRRGAIGGLSAARTQARRAGR